MARSKSELLSAMGIAWEIFKAIANEVLSLGGNDDDLRRILKDGKLRKEIAALIVKVKEVSLPTWMTIKLGTGLKTADDFRQALKDGGFRLGDWGNDILGKPAFSVAGEETEIELVKVSVAELGFEESATRKQIYDRALELGLSLCPNEVGPQLRLQYKDQPRGEWFLIAMEPITDSFGNPLVFDLEHGEDGVWLNGGSGYPDDVWFAGFVWVFARRK